MGIFLVIFFAFVGFAIGRYGDKYFGYFEKIWKIPVPHHWMWGLLIVIVGGFFNYYLISFGIGLFVSDLNDFYHARFFGEEPPHKWNFWSIE